MNQEPWVETGFLLLLLFWVGSFFLN
jgi:hypothetical protein